MASLKNLKKDVNFLTDEVIGTCMMHQFASKKEEHEKVDKLIDQMLDKREETINKINHPHVTSEKSVKSYYNEVFEEFLTEVNDIFDALGGIEE